MKNTITFLLGILACVCFLAVPSYAATASVPSQVIQVANDGLKVFKERAAQAPLKWGFSDATEVAQMSLGEAFQIQVVDPEKLKKGISDKLLELSHPNNEWLFLTYVNDQPKSFLTVGIEKGEYHLISYGGKAKEFGDALHTFQDSVQNSDIKPIVVKDKNVHYLVTNMSGQEFNVPDTSASNKMKQTARMDNTKAWPSSLTVKLLKDQQANSSQVDDAGVMTEKSAPIQWQLPTLLLMIGGFLYSVILVYRKRIEMR
ncbi:hypothetical protein [Tumebacillus flagellatus]|uniref:TPM domain-containing protein n=1 Tax=Tumebacillus flagellatus TaxID=1157490 RepID=A0A074LQ93_9BACL|nr:hypothetical protein [Tumebacillus flagellatus]KEO82013.1 hypothetical protein EL26_17745 [Tumebacillus flagellatus]